MFKAHEVFVAGNIDKWVNIDGEGENVGNELHFVNHTRSIKIMKRDMKRALISHQTSENLQVIREQLEQTRAQLLPKKK